MAVSVVAWAWAAGCLTTWGFAEPAAEGAARASASGPLERSTQREAAIERLVSLSRHENAQVRANAVEALSSAPSRVSEVVGDRLLDANEGVRSVAAMVAGRLRLREHIERLEMMVDDSSPYVRASVVFALRRCDVDQNPSELADMVINHSDPRVRAHAAYILGELRERSALGLLRQASGEPMRRASSSQVDLLRLQIAEAMVKLGDEAQLSVLRAALYPARPEQLEATALAVQILGEVEDKGAIDQLIMLARSASETDRVMPAEVRLAAASSLAKLGLPQGTFVADEYRADPSPVLRAQCAMVYGDTRQGESLGVVVGMCDDASELVRVAASGAVLKITAVGGARAQGSR